jgi:flagellar protein FlgJ
VLSLLPALLLASTVALQARPATAESLIPDNDLSGLLRVVAAEQARNSDLLPAPLNATAQQIDFIMKAAIAAQKSQLETRVPASVTIAQAILESEWGRSKLARNDHNYFGIKAFGKELAGPVAWYDVWEVVDGVDVIESQPFRAYANQAESFVDHGHFFLRNSRYAAALAVSNDPRRFAEEIARAGYATDPGYAPKLISLMDRFNLYAYDIR